MESDAHRSSTSPRFFELIPRNPGIDFIRLAPTAIAASMLAIVIGLASIWIRGGLNYGIDFVGGTMVEVRFPKPSVETVRITSSAAPWATTRPASMRTTQSASRRPSSGCRCFGLAECMRVPRPAARMIAAGGVWVTGQMAGAPGFEPGIAGPKPAALPLGYAPSHRFSASVAAKCCRRRRTAAATAKPPRP